MNVSMTQVCLQLEEAAEAAAGKAGHPPLHFHNFVCGSDIVPRC